MGEDEQQFYTQSNRINRTPQTTQFMRQHQQQQIKNGMAVSDATNNNSTLGSVALNDILSQDSNIETQSNHSNATYTSNNTATEAAIHNNNSSQSLAMHIYQSNATSNNNRFQSSNLSTINKKPGKRARSSK